MGQNFFETWLSRLNSQLKELAASENAALRDYSTTLLAAILGPSSAVFFQIGDGAIVVGDPDQPEEFSWIFWPDQGAYANETTFVTSEGAAAAAQFSYVERQINEAALFSDGIQRLALNIASQTVHSPFFRHLFGPLRHEAAGLSQRISGAIELFLDSEAVCERTDDDKTLVLARRVFDE